jgi:spore coat polysaccharide biosynthesis protein SpsF
MKVIKQLYFRLANENDVDLYYHWANDIETRKNSFTQNKIDYTNHIKWFLSKIKSRLSKMYLFFDQTNVPVGQVRIDKNENEVTIGLSIDKVQRGKSYAATMIEMACENYLTEKKNVIITAYIKKENIASYKSFKKAGFINDEIVTIENHLSYKLIKKH